MPKHKKISSINPIVLFLIIVIAVVFVIGISESLKFRATSNSRAYDSRQTIDDKITSLSCRFGEVRYGRLINAVGGIKCFDSVSFTCWGGEKDNDRITLNAPVGSGGCLSEDSWKPKMLSSCGCREEDPNFGDCRYKSIDFKTNEFYDRKVRCSSSGGACFYDADITCDNGNKFNVTSASCTVFKNPNGSDWEFFANVVCCKISKSDTPGDDRPKACRSFSLHDYSLCTAYCKNRGFQCVSDTDSFRCNDDRPESKCK